MLVFEDAFGSSDLPRGGICAIGNFDGLHRGQRQVVETVVERARAAGVPSVVITFEPHPVSVLRPQEAPLRLTTPAQRQALLEEAGVDVLLIIRFTEDFAHTEAETFAESFLVDTLAVREVHVGARFVFGHRRRGNVELLQEVGQRRGFEAFGVEEVRSGGERISSTLVRRSLLEGKVERAAQMLGRAYAVTGEVVRGDRMGRRLGWPTINLAPDNELLPADGVYAGRVHFPTFPATFDCSINIGTRPTVYENYQRVLEAHILDFATTVYGERVEVFFHKRLREERIFPTVMDLATQIGRDVEATREFFAARRGLADQVEGAPGAARE